MVERRPTLGILAHVVLILGVLIVALPVYITFVASTHANEAIIHPPMPLTPGSHMVENYTAVLTGTEADAAFVRLPLEDADDLRLLTLGSTELVVALPLVDQGLLAQLLGAFDPDIPRA